MFQYALQLINNLIDSHAVLRRHVLILSYLPDPVAVIALDGNIKFCNFQLVRILGYGLDDLVGANIEDLCVPSSRRAIHKLITDMETIAEHFSAGMERNESDIDNVQDSGESSGEDNLISRSSDQSFPLLEVHVDDQDQAGSRESYQGCQEEKKITRKAITGKTKYRSLVSTLTQKSSSLAESSIMEDSDRPTTKKQKTLQTKCNPTKQYLDDVMDPTVPVNNSIDIEMHYSNEEPKEGANKRKIATKQKPQQEEFDTNQSSSLMSSKQKSSSSTDSQAEQQSGRLNSSEDSGHRGSNGSSSDNAEDSSSSVSSSILKGQPVIHFDFPHDCISL